MFSTHPLLAALGSAVFPVTLGYRMFAYIATYALFAHTLDVSAMLLTTLGVLVFWRPKAPILTVFLSALAVLIAFAALLFAADHTYKQKICTVAAKQDVEDVKVHSLLRYMTRDQQSSFPYPEGLGPLAAGQKDKKAMSWDRETQSFKHLDLGEYYQFKSRPGVSGCQD
jgi:hypothetical protein